MCSTDDSDGLLQKWCTFNLDVTGAVVALKTGLQIESVRQAAKEKTTSSVDQDQVDRYSLTLVIAFLCLIPGIHHGMS